MNQAVEAQQYSVYYNYKPTDSLSSPHRVNKLLFLFNYWVYDNIKNKIIVGIIRHAQL